MYNHSKIEIMIFNDNDNLQGFTKTFNFSKI